MVINDMSDKEHITTEINTDLKLTASCVCRSPRFSNKLQYEANRYIKKQYNQSK